MRQLLALIAVAVIATGSAGLANAQGNALIVKKSTTDFVTTVERLRSEIEARGATIVAVVDHAAAAKANGLDLRPTTVIIFGNPKLGTPLMQERQTAGIDLPLKILVWEDTGQTNVGYWPPATLAARHGIEPSHQVIGKMTNALDAITTAGTAN